MATKTNWLYSEWLHSAVHTHADLAFDQAYEFRVTFENGETVNFSATMPKNCTFAKGEQADKISPLLARAPGFILDVFNSEGKSKRFWVRNDALLVGSKVEPEAGPGPSFAEIGLKPEVPLTRTTAPAEVTTNCTRPYYGFVLDPKDASVLHGPSTLGGKYSAFSLRRGDAFTVAFESGAPTKDFVDTPKKRVLFLANPNIPAVVSSGEYVATFNQFDPNSGVSFEVYCAIWLICENSDFNPFYSAMAFTLIQSGVYADAEINLDAFNDLPDGDRFCVIVLAETMANMFGTSVLTDIYGPGSEACLALTALTFVPEVLSTPGGLMLSLYLMAKKAPLGNTKDWSKSPAAVWRYKETDMVSIDLDAKKGDVAYHSKPNWHFWRVNPYVDSAYKGVNREAEGFTSIVYRVAENAPKEIALIERDSLSRSIYLKTKEEQSDGK